MGVIIESFVWEPNPWIYIFIFVSCIFSIVLFSDLSKNNNRNTNNTSTSLYRSLSSSSFSFLRFQRRFLLLYSLASVLEGLWSVFGEFELVFYGASKDQIVTSLCVGFATALLFGTFLGFLSDAIGHKKACLIFCILHVTVGAWKRVTSYPSIWFTSFCLSLASSIFSFSFESLVIIENRKQGCGQDTLNDTFWLMTFLESVSLIGSQVIANWAVGSNMEGGVVSTSGVAILLGIAGVIVVTKGWTEASQNVEIKCYQMSYGQIFSDKRILLLVFAHASVLFSTMVFWILWAPTLVADGREVHLGLIFPCLMGAKMIGSSVFPWLLSGPSSLRTEDCLAYAFVVVGLVLSIVAYDYQEIGVLLALFFVYYAGVGLILPSLAKLRTMHVPNELRGGMMSLSLAPANAALLFLLIQRHYYQNCENSTMMAVASLGLFVAAGCMYLLKRGGKQPYRSWQKL